MKQNPIYVLYDTAEGLNQFCVRNRDKINLSSPNTTFIPSLDPKFLDSFDVEFLFNTKKAKELLFRNITQEEIRKSLSVIQCYKAILADEEIADHNFVLVTDSDVSFVPDFEDIVTKFKNKYWNYDVVFLQRGNSFKAYDINSEVNAYYLQPAYFYDSENSKTYIIKKSVIREILKQLETRKPFWLAYQYSKFISLDKMIIADHNLAFTEIKTDETKKLNTAPKEPLFSVIIPIYNVEKYLTACIDSVLAQNYHNYEIILVDDGSPDNCFDICIDYAKKYSNIQLIHKINGGLSDARNYGINAARGEYVMFLDSDDLWDGTDIFNDLESIISEEKVDLIINSNKVLDDDTLSNRDIINAHLFGEKANNDLNLLLNHAYDRPAWLKIVKRDLIIKNNIYFPKGLVNEDFGWSFDLLLHINNYKIYNNSFYIYRGNRAGSILNQKSIKLIADPLKMIINGLHKLLSIQDSNRKTLLIEYLRKGYPSIDTLPENKEIQELYNECEELWKHIIPKIDFKW